ncbi:MAG: lysophospholipid acyltransferase family protein [Polyangiaceae bacterium]|nr:lysophospholipid acyltransferase family protein [Polyangiaceae bacterium]
MNAFTALARLTQVAETRLLPLAGQALAFVERSRREVSVRLLGHDFDRRVAMLRERYASAGGDPFGLDPEVAARVVKLAAFFHRFYFRTECQGIEGLPKGRVLIVGNHSGQLPWDATVLAAALFLDAEPPRVTRAMVDKWAFGLPFISTLYSRVGQVPGLPENARRLLQMDETVLVFPEGMRGINKPFSERYQMQDFSRGFMRLALETNTPIVPVAIVGAEEQYVNLGNIKWAAKAFGLESLPVIPQMFVPGGQLPLPTKYHIRFGEPMYFTESASDDSASLDHKVWLVREEIQNLLNGALSERKGVFR